MSKPTIREYAKANYKRQTADEMCAELMKLGYDKRNIGNIFAKMRGDGVKIGYMTNPITNPGDGKSTPKQQPKRARAGVVSLKEFIEENDIVKRVERAVISLQRGELMYESAFVNEYVPRRPGYRDAINDPKFDKYHGIAPGGKVLWGHPADIEQCKQKGILR